MGGTRTVSWFTVFASGDVVLKIEHEALGPAVVATGVSMSDGGGGV
jgi:hypothetical protein